jgi:hypothetical protein
MRSTFTSLEVAEIEGKAYETGLAVGRTLERERIRKVADYWIGEMLGHDGECACGDEARVLKRFIEHDDFIGGNYE